jgi:hypothetical protein
MAIITLMGRSTEPVANVSVVGSVVTVAGVSVDCDARQDEKIVHVEVRQLDDLSYAESDEGNYVGTVVIPAKTPLPVVIEVDDVSAGIVSETGGGFAALDPNAIIIQLWPHVQATPSEDEVELSETADEQDGALSEG